MGNKQSRWHRFRRWLAYKILPGTSEFNVAIARRRALHELSIQHKESDSKGKKEEFEEAYTLLKNRLPIQDEWDARYTIENHLETDNDCSSDT